MCLCPFLGLALEIARTLIFKNHFGFALSIGFGHFSTIGSPEVSIFDAQFFRVEDRVLDALFALVFIVLQALEGYALQCEFRKLRYFSGVQVEVR